MNDNYDIPMRALHMNDDYELPVKDSDVDGEYSTIASVMDTKIKPKEIPSGYTKTKNVIIIFVITVVVSLCICGAIYFVSTKNGSCKCNKVVSDGNVTNDPSFGNGSSNVSADNATTNATDGCPITLWIPCTQQTTDKHQCPNLSNITNGIVTITTHRVLGVATYSCELGYVLNGTSTRVCREQGLWSGVEPVCKSPDCPLLPTPQNGQVIHDGLKPGNVTNYKCDIGFVLSKNTTRTCEIGGSWSGHNPKCSVIECPNLYITNGIVTITSNRVLGVATYSCELGYLLIGTSTRVCREQGLWSGVKPVCKSPEISTYGNSFTTAFMTSYNIDELSIMMVSTEKVTVTIESPYPDVDTIVTFTDIYKHYFSNKLMHSIATRIENKGVSISSTKPIAVFASNFATGGADAHLVYPDTIISKNYFISTFPKNSTEYQQHKEEFLIVGTVDSTEVTISIPSQPTIQINIDRLQSYQYQGIDLSGTHIQASKNIVVISGNECAHVPNISTKYCDYMVDQMVPTDILQTAFIVSFLSPRRSFTIQLISSEDATVVTIYNSTESQLESITMNRGDSQIRTFSNNDIISIISTNGIIVSQYNHGGNKVIGDPSSIIIPGIVQYDNNYIFSTVDNFPTHFVSITMHTTYDFDELKLDGQSVGGNPTFQITVPELGTYKVMYVQVSTGRHILAHLNANARYEAIIYGYDKISEYSFPVGMRL